MLLLPKKLGSDDVVVVTGNIERGARNLNIGLVTGTSEPDNQNVACQLEVNFPTNGANKIAITIIQDGNRELLNDSNPATDYFIDGEEFAVQFKVWNENFLNIYVGPSFLDKIQLKHYVHDIRFLFINGDVKLKKFEYEFS